MALQEVLLFQRSPPRVNRLGRWAMMLAMTVISFSGLRAQTLSAPSSVTTDVGVEASIFSVNINGTCTEHSTLEVVMPEGYIKIPAKNYFLRFCKWYENEFQTLGCQRV